MLCLLLITLFKRICDICMQTYDFFSVTRGKGDHIHQRLHRFSRRAQRPLELLRPMTSIGAGTSRHAALGPGQWRRLARAWPDAETPTLTWQVLSLMLNR